jgi:hypothetical protein
MASRQDSSHPTGVVDEFANGKGEPARIQRNRKADAALSMKMSGATWSEIAMTLGYPTPRQAMLAVEKALVRQLNEDDDRAKMRQVSGARLERLLRGIWNKAINPNDPEQMTAVSRARELIADHNKLYGLNAPTEVTVHSPTNSELEDWVLQMTATMVPDVAEPDIYDAEVLEIEAS